jgi:5-(carboxyamino)imidazole ribonucleotide synthase
MGVKTIGMAGGGQLGRMLTDAAHKLGYKVIILDPTPNSPAGQVADEQIVGDYKDEKKMLELASKSDFVTYEIESVNADALKKLVKKGKKVHPVPQTLSIIKDKFLQKTHLRKHGIPVADFMAVNLAEKTRGLASWEFPYILKARSGGFDGRGNRTIGSEADFKNAVSELGEKVYAEKIVAFKKELAVVAVRTVGGKVVVYPLVETIHKDHICHMTLVPAKVSSAVEKKARALAAKALRSFKGAGVFGIEMFLVKGKVLVNEIAPRVHNSGHWTIEGSETSQFEQHIRAVTGMKFGSVKMKALAVVMINILGKRNGKAVPRGIMNAEKIKGVKVHIYGKIETRMQRKMGHLTAIAKNLKQAKTNAEKARRMISI